VYTDLLKNAETAADVIRVYWNMYQNGASPANDVRPASAAVDGIRRSPKGGHHGALPDRVGLCSRGRLATRCSVIPRGLSRREVAALAGLSPTAFDKARREGKYPGPTLPGGRYDRNLIEKAMDRLSGLNDSRGPSESADDSWNDFSASIRSSDDYI
jgi:hypothetical protein